uniref:Proline-rich protein PRCC n=1 Tax=Lotharella globosa TaxID=91324 RepID=A0A7S4DMR8_9EUKA|mmetsp:Transcript_22489/g.43778  ORF Transcript_22489/g.43778 Transcript_22489/m.43778 type:complete len:421 (+) Transcript_22489:31-1293(+)
MLGLEGYASSDDDADVPQPTSSSTIVDPTGGSGLVLPSEAVEAGVTSVDPLDDPFAEGVPDEPKNVPKSFSALPKPKSKAGKKKKKKKKKKKSEWTTVERDTKPAEKVEEAAPEPEDDSIFSMLPRPKNESSEGKLSVRDSILNKDKAAAPPIITASKPLSAAAQRQLAALGNNSISTTTASQTPANAPLPEPASILPEPYNPHRAQNPIPKPPGMTPPPGMGYHAPSGGYSAQARQFLGASYPSQRPAGSAPQGAPAGYGPAAPGPQSAPGSYGPSAPSSYGPSAPRTSAWGPTPTSQASGSNVDTSLCFDPIMAAELKKGVKFVDVSADTLRKQTREERLFAEFQQSGMAQKSIEEQTAFFFDAKMGDQVPMKVSKLHKRRHHINSLAHQAAVNEFDLAMRRAKHQRTKRETAAKYGW